MVCILHKCLTHVGNGTEYVHSTLYMVHTTLRRCVSKYQAALHLCLGIEVWAVSNLTFVLLSYTQLHSTTEVPFIVLASYSLRSGTRKRVNGDATRAIYRLRKGVSLALYAIPAINVCTMCVASSTSMII